MTDTPRKPVQAISTLYALRVKWHQLPLPMLYESLNMAVAGSRSLKDYDKCNVEIVEIAVKPLRESSTPKSGIECAREAYGRYADVLRVSREMAMVEMPDFDTLGENVKLAWIAAATSCPQEPPPEN